MAGMIDVATLGGGETFQAYAADPATAPTAAVVVIQEIFGINPGIRAKCDRLAGEGYFAIAPDLFWRLRPGVQLDPDDPDQLKQAFGFVQQVDIMLAIADIEATIRTARERLRGAGKVGAVGYCFGGRLAYLTATRTDVDASVGYYGSGIDGLLGESRGIARPLLLHFAGEDAHVTPDKLAAIRAALDPNPHVTIHEYPGAHHGFATEFGKRREDPAAELADSRSAEFLRRHLG